MDEVEQERRYRDYTAITQNNLARLLAAYLGADYGMPEYIEFMYPELKEKDKRSMAQIAQDIVGKLLARPEG